MPPRKEKSSWRLKTHFSFRGQRDAGVSSSNASGSNASKASPHREVDRNVVRSESLPNSPRIPERTKFHIQTATQTNSLNRAMITSAGGIETSEPMSDPEIYREQLLLKGRGTPLWIPGPSMTLPLEYRRVGISIGDVGIINPSGEFSFLFNLFLPADHPINRGKVPESFSPLHPSEAEDDNIEQDLAFGPNSYLASPSLQTGDTYPGFTFESRAQKGAVLVMPEGATSRHLRNSLSIDRHAVENAKHWYKYAIEVRGRSDLQNGDIRVVVSLDKVSCWGIATFATTMEEPVRLEFKVNSHSQRYCWDCIGTGSGRTGPQEVEMRNIRKQFETDVYPLQNQCVFVRTTNVHFSDGPWNELTGPLYGMDSRRRFTEPWSSRNRHAGGWSTELEASVIHPSTSINQWLLAKFPTAQMVISHDSDWISVLTEEDITFPAAEELCARILATREICVENGIVSIKAQN